jgi:hypothetical protein
MKHFDKFGIMVDCSRDAVMSVAGLKRLILVLEKMGYNCLALYIEDTYEVKDEPYFGYLRGRYSENELREIKEFGESHGVTVTPWIQTLAHLNCMFRWPEYAEINDSYDVILADEERTYVFFDHVFSSLARVFPGAVINIGMDETDALGLGKHLKKHGYELPQDIYFRHLERIVAIAHKYDFKLLMWGDMILRYRAEGKDVNAFRELGVTPICWDYYHDDRKHYDEEIEQYESLTDNLYFAGGAWTWAGVAPLTSLAIRTMKDSVDSCIAHGVRNYFVTCWGDNGAECSVFNVIPALYYVKERAEGITDMRQIKADFKKELGVSYDDFLSLEKPNYLTGGPKPGEGLNIINPSKCFFYNDPINGVADVSVKEEDDLLFSEFAAHFDAIKGRMGEFAYLAETQAAYCRFLSVKNSLGIKARRAYKAGDKAALEAMLPLYDEAKALLQEFLLAYRNQWGRDNKMEGFDVHQIRMGGLSFRLDEAKRRIKEYLDGKISRIDEFETELLPLDESQGALCYNNFQFLATPNRL